MIRSVGEVALRLSLTRLLAPGLNSKVLTTLWPAGMVKFSLTSSSLRCSKSRTATTSRTGLGSTPGLVNLQD